MSNLALQLNKVLPATTATMDWFCVSHVYICMIVCVLPDILCIHDQFNFEDLWLSAPIPSIFFSFWQTI